MKLTKAQERIEHHRLIWSLVRRDAVMRCPYWRYYHPDKIDWKNFRITIGRSKRTPAVDGERR